MDQKYTLTLQRKEEAASGTMAFYWTKPAGFEYTAGQSVDMYLINPPETDPEGNMRAFSIASAPHEDLLMNVSRMRDTAFKRVLKNLPIGSKIEVAGPFGSFVLHNDVSKPAVFLVGGIGITPFLSMLRQAAYEGKTHTIYLFYSNRTPEDAPFLQELANFPMNKLNYHFIGTMTDTAAPSVQTWAGEKGYITDQMIRKYVPEEKNAIYYLAGPATMVKAMRTVLAQLGVDNDYIRTEEFSGY